MREKEILKDLINLSCSNNKKILDKLVDDIIEKYGSVYLFIKSDNKNLVKLSKKNKKMLTLIDLLIKEILFEDAVGKKKQIKCAKDLKGYLKYKYFDNEREIFEVIYLNVKNIIITSEQLFFGTIDKAEIHVREIVKNILRYNAKSIIILHNHPSGFSEPSTFDILLTEKLEKILAYFDVKLLDHLIVTNSTLYSYLERQEVR